MDKKTLDEKTLDEKIHHRTVNRLKSSNWMHGSAWLLSQEYPNQDNEVVVVQELTIEINPVNPVPPVIDLTRLNLLKQRESCLECYNF